MREARKASSIPLPYDDDRLTPFFKKGRDIQRRYGEDAYRRDLTSLLTALHLLLPGDHFNYYRSGTRDLLNGLRSTSLGEQLASLAPRFLDRGVVGIGTHLFDPLVGRETRIWLSDRAPGAAHGLSPELREAFTHLWMKVYWHLLRTDTTLLNAIHERRMPFNPKTLVLEWSDSGTSVPSAVVSLGRIREVLPDLYNELDELVNEVNKTIRSSIEDEPPPQRQSDGEYEAFLDRLRDDVVTSLKANCIEARLREWVTDCERRIIADSGLRGALADVLNGLSSSSQIAKMLQGNHWSQAARADINEWVPVRNTIEAIRSAVLNMHAFCDEHGFLIAPVSVGQTQMYVLLGLTGASRSKGIADLVSFVDQYLRTFLKHALEYAARRRHDDPPTIANVTYPDSELAGKAGELLWPPTIGTATSPLLRSALLRWLSFLTALARICKHEGHGLRFLTVLGSAYYSRVYCRLLERAPRQLQAMENGVDYPAQIAQFLKSYFSVFGGSDSRVAWFGPTGTFLGVFEAVLPGESRAWLQGWPETVIGSEAKRPPHQLVASVQDRGIMIWDAAGKVVMRIADGRVQPPEDEQGVNGQVQWASNHVWKGASAGRASQVASTLIVAQLALRAREQGHGTGIIVTRGRGGVAPNEWRLLPDEQINPLAVRLERFSIPRCDLKRLQLIRNPGDVKAIVDELFPLTELDGALYLTFDSRGLTCSPACQVVPLYRKKGEETTQPFGLYSLHDEKNVSTAELDKTQDALVKSLESREKGRGVRLTQPQACALVSHVSGYSLINCNEAAAQSLGRLNFLRSAGTRHHSLWGFSLTAQGSVFVVTISQDGDTRVFWDGSVAPPSEGLRGR